MNCVSWTTRRKSKIHNIFSVLAFQIGRRTNFTFPFLTQISPKCILYFILSSGFGGLFIFIFILSKTCQPWYRIHPSNFRFTPETGNYSQMVWATSFRVGCGYIFQNSKHILACNYAPAGNVEGTAMYIAGEPCSACPSTHPNCEQGELCIA